MPFYIVTFFFFFRLCNLVLQSLHCISFIALFSCTFVACSLIKYHYYHHYFLCPINVAYHRFLLPAQPTVGTRRQRPRRRGCFQVQCRIIVDARQSVACEQTSLLLSAAATADGINVREKWRKRDKLRVKVAKSQPQSRENKSRSARYTAHIQPIACLRDLFRHTNITVAARVSLRGCLGNPSVCGHKPRPHLYTFVSPVSLCFKTTNVKILSAYSKHRSYLLHYDRALGTDWYKCDG